MAIAMLHESRRRGPHPTASVYLAAAHACATAGKWQEGSDLITASANAFRANCSRRCPGLVLRCFLPILIRVAVWVLRGNRICAA